MKIILCVFALAGLACAQKLTPLDEAAYAKLVVAHKGKVVLVNFWATWCKPCRAEMPDLAKLDQKLRARGFELVTILADEPDAQGAALNVLKQNSVAGVTY